MSVKNIKADMTYLKEVSQHLPGGTAENARLAGLQVKTRIYDLLNVMCKERYHLEKRDVDRRPTLKCTFGN
jgi:hypothetical protein